MNDYCVTFVRIRGSDEPEEVFHCHVIAPNDQLALEVALHRSVDDNIRLDRSDAVSLRLVLPLSVEVMDALELVRTATHGATATPTPMAPASHLH